MSGFELPDLQVPDPDIEIRLLQNPVDHAGELYDLYQSWIDEIVANFDDLDTSEEGSRLTSLFSDLCNRQHIISRLLPENDSRSYIAWKRESNKNA